METIQIKGAKRENFGKKGSKDVRREGRVPAVIYGGHEETIHFSLEEKEMKPLLFTPNSYIVELDIDGRKEQAVMR
ncbi:MAG: 50S ribosomal protein L25, partial [Tidjanibacter sp.]|nr:50S ribosomal protein L25 [Tidjanibacter sp.]